MTARDLVTVLLLAVPIAAFVYIPRWFRATDLREQKKQRAPRAFGPPKVGEWVRILVPIIEKKVELGAIGRIRLIVPADDVEYWIEVEGIDGFVMFTRDQTWQFEVLAGKP